MDSRFTLKDAFFSVLLLSVIGIVGLAMWQFNRQNQWLLTIDAKQADTTKALASIEKRLSGITALAATPGGTTLPALPTSVPAADAQPGVAAVSITPDTPFDASDPFLRLHEAMKAPDFATGDWLVQNVGTKLAKITPLLSSDIYANYIKFRVMEPLAYRDPTTLEWSPALATKWETKDNSEAWAAALKQRVDGGVTEQQAVDDATMPVAMEITFDLRQNVVYSDGTPFTADDIVFTFSFLMTDAVDAARDRSAWKEVVRSVEKIDDHKVVFKFKRPYFEAFSLAATSDILAKHFFGHFATDPQSFNDSVGLMIGTGPYRLESPDGWRPGKAMILVRNERYWGPPAPFSRLVFREIENEGAALIDFNNGDQDTFGATPDQYEELKDEPKINARANRHEYYALDSGYTYISWNQKRGGKPTRFADKRVRQAMTMLIDRDAMARDIWRGYAKSVSGPFSPVSKQNAPEIKPWPFDPAQARKLLREAGYVDRDRDGILDGPDGVPFKLQLRYNAGSAIGKRIAFFIKDALAGGGVAVETEPTDWPIMLDKLRNQDFDAITLGWSGGAETDIYQMFSSTQIAGGGDNVQSYSNPDLDRAMVAARSTLDEGKRMALWQECHRILHEDQPYTFLLVRQDLRFIDKRIANVKPAAIGLNFMNNSQGPVAWYVPQSAQKRTN